MIGTASVDNGGPFVVRQFFLLNTESRLEFGTLILKALSAL